MKGGWAIIFGCLSKVKSWYVVIPWISIWLDHCVLVTALSQYLPEAGPARETQAASANASNEETINLHGLSQYCDVKAPWEDEVWAGDLMVVSRKHWPKLSWRVQRYENNIGSVSLALGSYPGNL